MADGDSALYLLPKGKAIVEVAAINRFIKLHTLMRHHTHSYSPALIVSRTKPSALAPCLSSR